MEMLAAHAGSSILKPAWLDDYQNNRPQNRQGVKAVNSRACRRPQDPLSEQGGPPFHPLSSCPRGLEKHMAVGAPLPTLPWGQQRPRPAKPGPQTSPPAQGAERSRLRKCRYQGAPDITQKGQPCVSACHWVSHLKSSHDKYDGFEASSLINKNRRLLRPRFQTSEFSVESLKSGLFVGHWNLKTNPGFGLIVLSTRLLPSYKNHLNFGMGVLSWNCSHILKIKIHAWVLMGKP